MTNKQDKGFTLVELLIVIVILGILATVTVFAVRGITDRGQQNACDVDQRTLDTSVEAFYAQYQRDPANIGELTGGVNGDQPLLRDAPSNFVYVPATATFDIVPNGPCDL
jgi:prepilin-type N-terminal cleavage/methylation domain-containing protein